MRLRWSSALGSLFLVAMIAVMAAVAGPRGAFAQATPDPSAGAPVSLPGFQQVAARMYTGDMQAIRAAVATPGASIASGVVTATAVVVQFDSDASAAAGYEPTLKQMTGPASTGGIELKDVVVEGFSGKANAYAASIAQDGGITLYQTLLVAQDGPFIYELIVVSIGSADETHTMAVDVAKAMIAAPVGSGKATFVKDGTSTGGIWDKFPKAGDAVLHGLKPSMDDQTEPAS